MQLRALRRGVRLLRALMRMMTWFTRISVGWCYRRRALGGSRRSWRQSLLGLALFLTGCIRTAVMEKS